TAGTHPRQRVLVGTRPERIMPVSGLLSGGLAGLAGVFEVLGTTGYLTADLSPGYGYTGIAVAMLAGLHPLGSVAAALFLSVIYIGANEMSRTLGVSTYIADVISASSLLAVLAATVLARSRPVRKPA